MEFILLFSSTYTGNLNGRGWGLRPVEIRGDTAGRRSRAGAQGGDELGDFQNRGKPAAGRGGGGGGRRSRGEWTELTLQNQAAADGAGLCRPGGEV